MIYELDPYLYHNEPSELVHARDDVLPNCPPTMTHPKDISAAINNARGDKADNIESFYASQIIGINPEEEPPFYLFGKEYNDMTQTEKENFTDFCIKYIQLIESNDKCDKVGIKYLGKILEKYCPSSNEYNSLNKSFKGLIFSITRNDNDVIKESKLWANCL